MNKKQIGIVGGMGSYAGLDLLRNVYDATNARCDEEHFPVTLISTPQYTPDRTRFLSGLTQDNPGEGILNIITRLASQGANIVGIPCNTAHAKAILAPVYANLPQGVILVHLIETVVNHIVTLYPKFTQVGVLSTTGTIISRVYLDELTSKGLTSIISSDGTQSAHVMKSIYDPIEGIKARSNPVSAMARQCLFHAMDELIDAGAEIIILGCTEIPLAISESRYRGVVLLDATQVLAQELVARASEEEAPDIV